MAFLIHTISSIIATGLIIWLSISCYLKKIKYHKELAIILVITSIISLISSILYGFTMDLSLEWANIHYWTGFTSLILSLIPMISLITKDDRWHYIFGYLASIMVVISLITGFIAFGGLLIKNQEISAECIKLSELNSTSKCLVAVDGIVYDMTSMPRWSTGKHYDYECGGIYTLEQILEKVPTHAAEKYYGPKAGNLCTE